MTNAGTTDRFSGKHRRGKAGLHVARSAPIQAAILDVAAKRIARPAEANRDDVEMAVQVYGGSVGDAVVTANDVDARMFRRVFFAAERRQQMHVGAMRAQLIANHRGAGFVIGAGRIHSRDANEPGREIDDLVARTINLRDHAVNSGALHSVNPI